MAPRVERPLCRTVKNPLTRPLRAHFQPRRASISAITVWRNGLKSTQTRQRPLRGTLGGVAGLEREPKTFERCPQRCYSRLQRQIQQNRCSQTIAGRSRTKEMSKWCFVNYVSKESGLGLSFSTGYIDHRVSAVQLVHHLLQFSLNLN